MSRKIFRTIVFHLLRKLDSKTLPCNYTPVVLGSLKKVKERATSPITFSTVNFPSRQQLQTYTRTGRTTFWEGEAGTVRTRSSQDPQHALEDSREPYSATGANSVQLPLHRWIAYSAMAVQPVPMQQATVVSQMLWTGLLELARGWMLGGYSGRSWGVEVLTINLATLHGIWITRVADGVGVRPPLVAAIDRARAGGAGLRDLLTCRGGWWGGRLPRWCFWLRRRPRRWWRRNRRWACASVGRRRAAPAGVGNGTGGCKACAEKHGESNEGCLHGWLMIGVMECVKDASR